MTEMERELEWLVSLMNPYQEAWKAFCWHKANALAAEFPAEFASLPAALTARMQSVSKSSGRDQSSTGELHESIR